MEQESLPPLGIHVEEEIDVTTILGGGGENTDQGEPEEPELV